MNRVQYLKFLLDDTFFAIKIANVEEILHIPEITRVPLSEDYIVGISNLRGDIVPVIDLKKRIKGSFEKDSELSRLIVINHKGVKTGFLVESISSIEEVDEEKVVKTDDYGEINSKYLEGIFESSDGVLVGVIDLNEILSIEGMEETKSSFKGAKEEFDKKEKAESDDSYGKKILTFRLNRQKFAIEIDYTREIIEKPEIEDIPTKSLDIIGVFNLRDEIIPVLDLSRRLDIKVEEKEKEVKGDGIRKIIIFIFNKSVIGLLVDEVEEVLEPLKEEIIPVPNTFDEISKQYVKSIFNNSREKEIIFLLNEKSLLNQEDIEDIDTIKKDSEFVKKDESESLTEKIAVFKLSNEEFGVNIEKVIEINRLSEITPVPKSASFIEGVINLRGEIIPVINLRERLGLGKKEYDEFERVIIVEIEGHKTGLIVDRVTEIKTVDMNEFKDIPKFLKKEVERELFEKIANIEDEKRIISIIAIDNILTKAEKNEFIEFEQNKSKKREVIKRKEIKSEKKVLKKSIDNKDDVNKKNDISKKEKGQKSKTTKKKGGRKKKLIKAK